MATEGFVGQIGGLTPVMDENNLPKFTKVLLYHVPLFDYRYQQELPDLIFTDASGIQYQLDRHFNTDGGSIPPIVRMAPGVHLDPFNFPRAYLFHDCTYQYGGIYIKYVGEEKFLFRLRTRFETDVLLGTMLKYDGATNVDQKAVMGGIWIGSRFVWDATKKPIEQKRARKDGGVIVYDQYGNIVPELP